MKDIMLLKYGSKHSNDRSILEYKMMHSQIKKKKLNHSSFIGLTSTNNSGHHRTTTYDKITVKVVVKWLLSAHPVLLLNFLNCCIFLFLQSKRQVYLC